MLNEEIKVTENEGKTVTVLTLEDCENITDSNAAAVWLSASVL